MTENTGFPSEPTDPRFSPEQYAQAAREISDQGAPIGAQVAAEQAASASQMTERGPLLPAEERIDELMAQLRAQSEALASVQGQLGVLQRQQEEAQAAAGGPLTVRYAQGAADKLAALVAARPDHADGHFAPAIDAAQALADGAAAVAKGNPKVVDDVKGAADAVLKFISRTHAKSGGQPLDWSAIVDDVELAVEEALKLAAVV